MPIRPPWLPVAALAVLSLGALALTLLALLPWWAALALVLLQGWFAWPGYLVVTRVMPDSDRGGRALLGPVVGLGLCTVGLLALWLLGARGVWMFALAPWPAWALLGLPLDRVGRGWTVPPTGRADLVAVLALLLVVPAVVGLPYAHVAAATADGGLAYRAYFTADFVWAMTVVAEVSKGDLPPANPFLGGDVLRYYWLAHFLSAASYRVAAPYGVTIEAIILGHSVGYGVVFLLFLYGFVRAWGGRAAAAGAAVAIVFLANSFEALERIIVWRPLNELWIHLVDINISAITRLERIIAWLDLSDLWFGLTDINIDAVTRWFHSAMPIDGLHRMLLYQPHHVTGYALGLLALLLVGRIPEVGRAPVALAGGVLLALSVLYSSFTAIIIGVAVSGVYAVRLLARPHLRTLVVCAVLGAVPVALAVLASTALGYVDPQAGGLLQVGPNRVAFRDAPFSLFLSLGPPLLLGALGLAVAVWRRHEALPVGMLVLAAFGFYFFTDVPDVGGVWVGWRSGHLLFIAAAALTALLFTWAVTQGAAVRRALWAATAVAVTAALPTVAIDVYNAQDLSNTRPGAGFPWVLRLTRGEATALDWLRWHTPAAAVVQPDTATRANASWGYITGFGERRMAAGLPIAMIPLAPYERATRLVHEGIFRQPQPDAIAQLAGRLGIDYIYIGPLERDTHPGLAVRLLSWPQGFQVAFYNEDVVIFRVVRSGPVKE